MAADDSELPFEELLGRLEEVVKHLESGELTLEASIEMYQRGVELSRVGHARLGDAEARIEALSPSGRKRLDPERLLSGEDEG